MSSPTNRDVCLWWKARKYSIIEVASDCLQKLQQCFEKVVEIKMLTFWTDTQQKERRIMIKVITSKNRLTKSNIKKAFCFVKDTFKMGVRNSPLFNNTSPRRRGSGRIEVSRLLLGKDPNWKTVPSRDYPASFDKGQATSWKYFLEIPKNWLTLLAIRKCNIF